MVAMQQVWPRFIPAVDHLEVYEQAPRPHSSDRPWVMLCMITSVDGSVSVQGRSAPLGGPVDWAVLTALRGCADAIVALIERNVFVTGQTITVDAGATL